jgi:hypothetical protein
LLFVKPLTSSLKSASLGIPSKGELMSKYLIDKAFALIDQAQSNNDLVVWREACLSAMEALIDESNYAKERADGYYQ